jgi:hypothetical protein
MGLVRRERARGAPGSAVTPVAGVALSLVARFALTSVARFALTLVCLRIWNDGIPAGRGIPLPAGAAVRPFTL